MIMQRRTGKAFIHAVFVGLVTGSSMSTQAGIQQSWDFRVLLDDREVGYHRVSVAPGAEGARVSVEARFDVKFLFIPAFRYEHEAKEVWKGSCLAGLESRTDKNGKQLSVSAKPADDGLDLTTADGESRRITGCVRSFAYWDPALLKSDRLLNTQSGEYQPVEVLDLGDTSLDIDGTAVNARQYRLLVDQAEIDLWYTPDMNWLALESVTRNGYRLSYLPRAVVSR